MPPKTASLASKMHVVCPRATSHRFRRPLDSIFIDFQTLQTSKTMKNTQENKGFCYVALFHSGSEKSPFRTRLGPPNPPKSLPKRLPGRPSGPKMASKPSLGPPRWPSRRAPSPPNRLPDRPRSNFGRPGTLQAPILAARDPFCLQFGGPKTHFGCPGTHFPVPGHPFPNPDFPYPLSSMPSRLQSSKMGEAECTERLNPPHPARC